MEEIVGHPAVRLLEMLRMLYVECAGIIPSSSCCPFWALSSIDLGSPKAGLDTAQLSLGYGLMILP